MQFHARKTRTCTISALVHADRSPGGARCTPIDLQWPKVWQNPTPILCRWPGAWTIICAGQRLRGCIYTYLIYTSSLRLFTQLTRHVLRKRVGPRRAMRTCVGQHPRACNARHARICSTLNQMRSERSCVLHGWKNRFVRIIRNPRRTSC